MNEDQWFDFKSGSLAKNPQAVRHISKAVSAFANSDGGFLIFGVDEKQPKGTGWIANPITPTTEFTQLFHQKLQVEPTPNYPTPREVPAGKGKAYYVVHIPASKLGPHASMASEGCVFYHRTHEGSVPMSYQHLKDALLGAETRRATVQLLIHELEHAYRLAMQHRMATLGDAESMDLTQFDLAVIRDAVSRLHTSIVGDVHAMEDLMSAIRSMRRVNGTLQMALLQIGSLGTKVGKVWASRISAQADNSVGIIVRARLAVGRVFGLDLPPLG